MNFKRKLLAALVALATAGSAHAAIDQGTASGDGSLFVNFKTGEGAAGVSATFDLGFTMNQALTWNGVAGLKLDWNLTTGAFSSNNTGLTGAAPLLSYGSTFSSFSTTGAQMSVLAFDGSTPGGVFGDAGRRVLTTSASTTLPAGPRNDQFGATPNSPTVTGFVNALNGAAVAGNHDTNANGASLSNPGTADFYNFGAGMDKFGGQSTWFDNTGLTSAALPFIKVVASSLTATANSSKSIFGFDSDGDSVIELNGANGNEYGFWTLQGDLLSYTNPGSVTAPIPEPGTYAMMLAGLALLGGVARRRMSV